MKIPPEEVKYLTGLAKINLSENEIVEYSDKLSVILEYMNKLNELDTSNVQPMTHPVEMSDVFREDVENKSLTQEDALRNAPLHDGQYFLVPKVIK